MKTQEEIVERIGEIKKDDFFGFESGDLMGYLEWSHVEPLLSSEQIEEVQADWKTQENTQEAITAVIKEYLPFAQEKAINHRGISASRSVSHLRAWFWLLGDDEMVTFIDGEDSFMQYGAPVLAKAASRTGASLDSDPGFERMVKGMACTDGCTIGCGR